MRHFPSSAFPAPDSVCGRSPWTCVELPSSVVLSGRPLLCQPHSPSPEHNNNNNSIISRLHQCLSPTLFPLLTGMGHLFIQILFFLLSFTPFELYFKFEQRCVINLPFVQNLKVKLWHGLRT